MLAKIQFKLKKLFQFFFSYFRLQKFLLLRDAYGSVQLIFNDELMWGRLKEVTLESVIEVSGVVAQRPEAQVNPKMSSGQIEVFKFVKHLNFAPLSLGKNLCRQNRTTPDEPLLFLFRPIEHALLIKSG